MVNMTDRADAAWVRALIERTQYLVLATTDGHEPWVAPLECMVDDDLNFYFFSTSDARHSRDIEANGHVAAVMFDTEQPAYTPSVTANLNGVQMECSARKLDASEYNEAVLGAIDALEPPMPPYEVFKITPTHFYVPRIENGVNLRYEVDMT
jgi:nitroimidazol reductase NimA-like FMN-containing flavoprotein (pyridoxamine 5'-phosphate oxidase superfamily)